MDQERLVVSNGSKQLERMVGSKWEAYKVEGKGSLSNGVYPLHAAKHVSSYGKGTYEGTIIHADKNSVYQSQGKEGLVRFDRQAFAAIPEIGRHVTVQFDYGRAQLVGAKEASAGKQANASADQASKGPYAAGRANTAGAAPQSAAQATTQANKQAASTAPTASSSRGMRR
jgi:hypothetical protein